MNTKILRIYSKFNPLLVGTILIDIDGNPYEQLLLL